MIVMLWFYFSLFTIFTLSSSDNTLIELFITIANLWLSINNWYLLITSGNSFSLFPWKKKTGLLSAVCTISICSLYPLYYQVLSSSSSSSPFDNHLIEKKSSFEVGICKNMQCFNSDIDTFYHRTWYILYPLLENSCLQNINPHHWIPL